MGWFSGISYFFRKIHEILSSQNLPYSAARERKSAHFFVVAAVVVAAVVLFSFFGVVSVCNDESAFAFLIAWIDINSRSHILHHGRTSLYFQINENGKVWSFTFYYSRYSLFLDGGERRSK